MNPETSPRTRGRTDGRDALRRSLETAPSDYLLGALDNPALGPEELALLLANRGATPETLARVGRSAAWLRPRAVKLALVAHPRTPSSLSRKLLPHLLWRELVEVGRDPKLSAALRREADRLVGRRLPELARGERVALSRVASRGLLTVLRDEDDAAILKALAGNPRLTESDLAHVLARPTAPGVFLGWLAEQSDWSRRDEVRLALVRHPRTPAPVALRLLGTLSSRDLRALAGDEAAPRLVRVAAQRRLDVDTPSGASLQSPADRRHPGVRGLSTSR